MGEGAANVRVRLPQPPFRKPERVVHISKVKVFSPGGRTVEEEEPSGLLASGAGEPPWLPALVGGDTRAAQSEEEAPSAVELAPDEFFVEDVVDVRPGPGGLQYLVRWEGYAQPTWEPAENLAGTTLIEDFWRRRAAEATDGRVQWPQDADREGDDEVELIECRPAPATRESGSEQGAQ